MPERSILHAAHEDAGAAFAETAGWLLAGWYGPSATEAVSAEYGAAREGAALVDLAERGLLEAAGPQHQKFLQGMLSSEVLNRQAGEGCLAALMTVKGHVRALLRALVTRGAVVLEMPADRLSPVEQTLLHYKVAAPVRFQKRPAAILGLLGPRSREALRAAGGEVPDLGPEAHVDARVAGQAVRVARASDLPGGGFVVHAEPAGAAAVWSALVAAGARPLGRRALDALRVEAGRPWYGPDVTEENLLHETGLVRECHSATKGCYIGQEVVIRVEHQGHVNKRLSGLLVAGDAVPPVKADILSGERRVGTVTSAVFSPILKRGIALGFVRRGFWDPGTKLRILFGGHLLEPEVRPLPFVTKD